MKLLLVTPPLLQLNTPYPATTHLQAFLKVNGYACTQMDLSIELVSHLFTRAGLSALFDQVEYAKSPIAHALMCERAFCLNIIEPVMRFLSGRDQTLAALFASESYWEALSQSVDEEEMDYSFGDLGVAERAKYRCTLFILQLCDLIKQIVHPQFDLIRYKESLCSALPNLLPIHLELEGEENLIDRQMLALLGERIRQEEPTVIGFSVPFPGNLYAALCCGRMIKREFPTIKIVMGGGYVNTELRTLTDLSLFRYIDYLTFDDGELPLLRLLEHLERGGPLLRTLCLNNAGELQPTDLNSTENFPFAQLPAPDYEGLTTNHYLDLVEIVNPMHRLWSNGRWNKMMLAHGCYWAKCTFCDVSLDYIKRYEAVSASQIVDRMESVIRQTGESGFHFVDEAAPPALLKRVAEEILKRNLIVTYWTNIRFESSYTEELCNLLAKSGCVAVAGGLEVASDRILKLINKGVSISTAAGSMSHFAEAGIMVHAYLMYGFPTQTLKETIDSLEVVRQLFEIGCIQSAFWHRFAMTVHSPVGLCPSQFNVQPLEMKPHPFANNEIPFTTAQHEAWEQIGEGLKTSVYNYNRGTGFEVPLHKWFGIPIPKTTYAKNYIERIIEL